MAPASCGCHCCFKAFRQRLPLWAVKCTAGGRKFARGCENAFVRCMSQHHVENADDCQQHYDGDQSYVLAAVLSLVVYFFLFVFHNRYCFVSTGKYSFLSVMRGCVMVFFDNRTATVIATMAASLFSDICIIDVLGIAALMTSVYKI